jgi:TrpR-related protein YerC/YecD
MAKFGLSKLSEEEQELLLVEFCDGLAALKGSKEAAAFVRDLLGPQEIEMIAKRLKIARMLINNAKYEDIVDRLKTSSSTIAKVHRWLNLYGEGYRAIVKRVKEREVPKLSPRRRYDPTSPWEKVTSKYPMLTPNILLEEFLRLADQRQMKKFQSVVDNLNKAKRKLKVFREINTFLRKYG